MTAPLLESELLQQVHELLGVVARYQKLQLEIPKGTNLAAEILLMQQQVISWDPLVKDLEPYPPEVLNYTAALLRTREALVGRRVQAVLGPARGNGMVGVLVSAFASAGAWSFASTFAPEPWKWVFGVGFVVTLAVLLYLSAGMITVAHSASKLLVIAELLEATAKLERHQATPRPEPVLDVVR